jgi:gamma-glutamylcysteine synthetase
VSHPTAVPDPELDILDEEEEEFIEPGQEEQYLPVKKEPTETEAGTEDADDEGVADDSNNHDDTESNEGDLEIAETTADSGINEIMDESHILETSA